MDSFRVHALSLVSIRARLITRCVFGDYVLVEVKQQRQDYARSK
jgi:hypothetical protein